MMTNTANHKRSPLHGVGRPDRYGRFRLLWRFSRPMLFLLNHVSKRNRSAWLVAFVLYVFVLACESPPPPRPPDTPLPAPTASVLLTPTPTPTPPPRPARKSGFGGRDATPTPFIKNYLYLSEGPTVDCDDVPPPYSKNTRREIYCEIVQAQDRAMVEAKAARRTQGLSWHQEIDFERERSERYERVVRIKYRISPDEQLCLTTEGNLQNWPLPPHP